MILTFEQFTLKLGKSETVNFHHKPTGSRAKVWRTGNTGWVMDVNTPAEHRGKGGAHEVMKKVTAYLDREKLKGSLSAVRIDPTGPHPKVLRKLYAKHGFRGGTYMEREPK